MRPGPSSTVSFRFPLPEPAEASGPARGSFLDPRIGVGMRRSQTRPLFCSYHRVSTLACISSPAASAGSRGFFARRKGPQPMFHCKARTFRVVLDKSLVHLERPILRVQIGCQSPHFTWLRRGEGKEKLTVQNPGAQRGFCTRLALPSSSFQRPGSSPSLEPDSRIRNRPLDGSRLKWAKRFPLFFT